MASAPASRDEEVAQAGHDLLNLLSLMRSYTSLVQRELDEPKLVGFLDQVQAAGAQATDLAHRIEEIGRAGG